MHERVGQFAVGRKDKQAGRRKIEPPYRNPSSALEFRQCVEHQLAPIGVATRRNLVTWFVVDDVSMFLRDTLHRQGPAVERDFLGTIDVIAESRRLAVDAQSTFPDPGLNLAPRSMARSGKNLLDALSQPGQATR